MDIIDLKIWIIEDYLIPCPVMVLGNSRRNEIRKRIRKSPSPGPALISGREKKEKDQRMKSRPFIAYLDGADPSDIGEGLERRDCADKYSRPLS